MKKIVPICIVIYICSVLCSFFAYVYFTFPKKDCLEYKVFPYPHVKLNKLINEKQIKNSSIDLIELEDIRVEMTWYNLFFIPYSLISIKNMDIYIKNDKLHNIFSNIQNIFNIDMKIQDLNIFYTANTLRYYGLENAKFKNKGIEMSLLQINNFLKNNNKYTFLLDNKLSVEVKLNKEIFDIVLEDDNISGNIHIELENEKFLLSNYDLKLNNLNDFILDYFNIDLHVNSNDFQVKGIMHTNKHIMNFDSSWIKGKLNLYDNKIKGRMDHARLEELLKILYVYNPKKDIFFLCSNLYFDNFNLLNAKINFKPKENTGYIVDEIQGDLTNGVRLNAKGLLYIKDEKIPSFKGCLSINDISHKILKKNFTLTSKVKINSNEYQFNNINIDLFQGSSNIKISPFSKKINIYVKYNNLDINLLERQNTLNAINDLDYFLNFEVYLKNTQYAYQKFDIIKILGKFNNKSNIWNIDNMLLKYDIEEILLKLKVDSESVDIKVIDANIIDIKNFDFLYNLDNLNLSGYLSSCFFQGEAYKDIYIDLKKENDFIEFDRLDFINSYGDFKIKGECDIKAYKYQFYYDVDLIEIHKYFNLFHGFLNVKGGGMTSGNNFLECVKNFKSKGDVFLKDVKVKILLHDFIKSLREENYILEDFYTAVANISSDGYMKLKDTVGSFIIKDNSIKVLSLPFVTEFISSNFIVKYDIDSDFFNLFAKCGFYMEVGKKDSLYNFKLFISGAKQNLGYNIKFDHHIIRLLCQRYFSQNIK